jgi:hypothetical protein
MLLGIHAFPADVEGVCSSSWTDVLYFWSERISCTNLGLFETKHEKAQKCVRVTIIALMVSAMKQLFLSVRKSIFKGKYSCCGFTCPGKGHRIPE